MVEFMSRYSLRERLIVLIGLIVVFVLGVQVLIIEPYQMKMSELEEQIEQGKSDLQWMVTMVDRLPIDGSGQADEEFDGSLANLINRSVKKQKIDSFLAQMTPKGEDEIRVRFTAIPFEKLIVFVALLNDQGLNVKDLRINSGDSPAQVDSSLVLDKG